MKKYGGSGAGAERERSGERGLPVTERGVSGERKFRSLPLRSHALLARKHRRLTGSSVSLGD